MKQIIIITICLIISLTSQAQSGSLIGIGVSNFAFETNEELQAETYTGLAFYASYELLPSDNDGYSGGFDFYRSINDDDKFTNVLLNLGYVISRKNRIQFPLFFNMGYFSVEGDNKSSLGNISIGVKPGIRFYLTNNLSLEGLYAYQVLYVNKIDEMTFDDSIGKLNGTNIALGLRYHINSK